MSIILITGTPGWIGTRLVHVLLDGLPDFPGLTDSLADRNIRVLIQPGKDDSKLGRTDRLEIVQGDLRRPVDMKQFFSQAEGGLLIHCAGVVHPKWNIKEFYEVNVQGTSNLISAAEKAGVKRVIALSSNSPMGNNPHRNHRFDEDSSYNPYMNYGRSKMQLEQIVQKFQAREKLETVILRPTWFYGPDQPERQTSFFRMIKNGSAPIVGGGENVRSMVYIDNLCQAILLSACHKAANGQIYWIADRKPYTMNQIVDMVERLMEQEFGMKVAHKRLRLPYLAGQVAQICDAAIQATGLYHQKIHVLSEMNKSIACSIAKAKLDFGYSPAIELEEGMRRSLAWCIQQGIPL